MMREEILKRNLPAAVPAGLTAEEFPAWRREMVKTIAKECFGVTPDAPAQVRVKDADVVDPAWVNKATCTSLTLAFDMEKGECSFPVHFVLPKKEEKVPAVVYISFGFDRFARQQPVEEIVDMGWAYAAFDYRDVTSDDEDMKNGIAALTTREGGSAWGKLGMWAYAASRVLDYLLTRPEIDPERIIVMGLSRLGKAALWAGAQDERFAGAVSVNSGCSGASVLRGKQGETIDDICRVFPFWFCENYQKYRKNEDKLPYEAYHLLACCAPRPVYVTSSVEDAWADPYGEFLSCVMLNDVYKLLGYEALPVADCEMIKPDGRIVGEKVGYHLRPGTHGISRYDWVRALRFMQTRV